MDTQALKRLVAESSRKHREEFSRVTGGFEDRGILNSEMLAVCAVAEELGVEVFIESGRWLGQSTEILAKYFEGKSVIIESVEAFYDDNALHVEKKLAGRKNLHLLYGDANLVIPRLARQYQGKKVALLFDGPKGQAALDVFRLALLENHDIVAGFFHDMRQHTPEMPNRSRQEMEAVFPVAFYTDDEAFVQEFQVLDAGCDVALWRPYMIDGKKIGSYGPTIGLVLPGGEDRDRAYQERLAIKWRSLWQIFLLMRVKVYHTLKRFFHL